MLLFNGRIHTLDSQDRVVDALVVRAGRVVFAGRRQDVNAPAGEPEIDLGGRAVLPGLVDAHGHLMYLARLRLTLDVAGLASETACAERVAVRATSVRAGEWISGRGWDQNRWPGARLPTRASLDRAAPEHPVALVRVDGHAIWASSAALRLGGIDRHTPDPDGGRLERDPSGEPTGILVDTAQELVRRVEPRPGPAQLEEAVRAAVGDCLAVGLTGVHEMGADLDALSAYHRLAAAGAFPFRNHVALRGADPAAWQTALEDGPHAAGAGRVVVGAVKLMADGALGSRGAALHAPYCDDPENRGLLLLPLDELEARARAAAARGFQVCVHAIGDRANTLVLDALERVLAGRPSAAGGRLAAVPGRDPRHRVEHAQILAETDIPRFRALGVLPSMQPTHCTSDMPWAEARLGADRLPGAYAWRSLLRTGTLIAGGSDFPVELPNPFHGIHAAVARRPRTGPDPGWQPEQRMTRAEAVRAFTAWNAYAAHQEAALGTLEPGKWADLVVCSADVFTCAETEIAAIEPVLTLVAGEIVLDRRAAG
ncbi:MAG TPA: amidohydrolase [Methylomirabilota bacterium]